MLLTLIGGFALSQAYRTVAGILSVPLIAQFGLSPHEMGTVAAAFHFAFGGMQLLMGIGIDVYGIRRTILLAFPLAIVGSVVSALANSPAVLVTGQALIGVGCAPAFLVCTVFIARYFPGHRFAAISGLALGLGGLGLIFTGTPLAWVVEQYGWRCGFWVLAGLSLLAWSVIFLRVFEPPAAENRDAPPIPSDTARLSRSSTLWRALKGYGELLRMPHTAGILALVFVGYASFITLRGLWLAPYLSDRFGQSLIYSGNIALVLSIISLFSPSFFGRLDPGDAHRRKGLIAFPWTLVLLFAILAVTRQLGVAVVCLILISIFMGCAVWQYADVRSAYPVHMTGRAMALFTMSMFLGVAVMQSLSGVVAEWALAHQHDKYTAVFASVSILLAAGSIAFIALPKPRHRNAQ
ncbi:MFS transporter [Lampropedia puyangensis]|uniref:MFS transporter n=2 Tax=Lampropedia puyangensis TaxID=1330072 RepID=A0A4S8F174_9BURK|nr:MFS transporter [Lampropedia puyangensis]